MEFDCVNKTKSRSERWKGRITSFTSNNGSYEFRIESRSSIHVIIGKTKYGRFACMPDFRVGCHLTDLKDSFWNTEKLIQVLGKVDGITVAAALSSIANEIKF